MNNKGIAPLQVLLPVLVLLIIGVFSFSYRPNISENVSDVLAAVNSKITQVTGRRVNIIPDLVVEESYEFNIYPKNVTDINNPNRDNFEVVVEISGLGAKKIADHYNNYGFRGRGFLLHSYYPMIGTAKDVFPEISPSSLSFREIKETGKPTTYRAEFNMGYLHKKAEFAFLKDIKKHRIFPPSLRVEGNSIVRDLPQLSEFMLISSTSNRIGFGIKLTGDDAYQKAKEIVNDQVEIELTNGQTRKTSLFLRPDSTRKAYWGITSVSGEVKSIKFAKPYFFDVTYDEQVPGNNKIRDWYLSPDRMSITRNIIAPSEELVTANVSYASSCPRFSFNSRTKCNLRFEFVGNSTQISKIMDSFKKGQVKAYNLRNFNDAYPNTSDVVLDSSITFVEGRKFSRSGKSGVYLNINGVSSSLVFIDFRDTGLKFNFFRVPANFSNLNGGGTDFFRKIR